jgi:hypothetical protein
MKAHHAFVGGSWWASFYQLRSPQAITALSAIAEPEGFSVLQASGATCAATSVHLPKFAALARRSRSKSRSRRLRRLPIQRHSFSFAVFVRSSVSTEP